MARITCFPTSSWICPFFCLRFRFIPLFIFTESWKSHDLDFYFFAFISGRPTIFNKPISPLNLKIGTWTLNRYADDRLNYSIGVWWCQLSTIALNFRYIYWHSILFCICFLSCASVTLKSMVFTPLSFMKYRVWDGLLVGIKGNVFVPFTQTCLLMEILVEPSLCWAII